MTLNYRILIFAWIFIIASFLDTYSSENNSNSDALSYYGYSFVNQIDGDEDPNAPLTPEQLEQKAEQLLLQVQADSRYIGFLANDRTYNLPVGIYKNIAGVEYTIVLDEFKLDPNGASLKAYMTIGVPGSTKKLGFYADNVRIGPEGIETAQLKLIRDLKIGLGSFSLNFRNDVTMVQWDCNGYQSTTIGGDVAFPAGLIKPLNATPADTVLMGSFFANFSDFSDVILGFNMTPFEVNGLPNFEFYPNGVFVDLSDLRNPTNAVYPTGFFPSGTSEQTKKLWRGVYIPTFTVKLPNGLSSGNQAMSISAQHMIIDGKGITGNIFASNILSLEQGKLNGWQFSIDTVGFRFLHNSFTNFKLTGEIKVPISDEENGFRYAGMLDSQGILSFLIRNAQPFDANLWGAHLTLYQNSLIEIQNINGVYKPRAVLHGQMNINLTNEVNLSEFNFENMAITTDAPYMTIGTCSMSSGLMAGLPVSISHIGFRSEGNNVGLNMVADVSFMSSNESGFGAAGSFTIWAERHTTSGFLGYSYKRTQIHGFAIDVNQGPFQFAGSLELFQDHPAYGKGFKGMIQARFQPGISVQAVAQFGKVNDYRYWYVDALASQRAGIPIFTGVAIYGFGGGASYRMKMVNPTSYAFPENYNASDTTKIAGVSLSSTTYTPDHTYGLGLQASVVLGTHPTPRAVNGQLTFRIQFYSGGGVESINLSGSAVMASNIGTNPTNAPIRLTMNIGYNFSTSTLYGVNEAFVNLAPALTGSQPGNKAGSVVFLFSPNEWYVYMGTPSSRIGLKVLNTMVFAGYLVTGTKIPPFPPPPNEVTSVVQNGNGVQSFDFSRLNTGGGFGFGSSFSMNTGNKEFLIFYGAFNLGVGFDIMLIDFGNEAYCDGFNPPLGVNGWYALGQAYAYMNGKIGVNFQLFGKDRKIDILNISAAALLQTKLPNPTYLAGYAGGSYNILGGLVSGQCNFEFSVGNDCVIMNANPLGNMSVIADISPTSGTTNVSVFVTPQVAFNIPIESPFQLVDENNQTKTYRVKLQYFNVLVNNMPFTGTQTWNADKNVVSFETTEIYPSFTSVSLDVKVIFQILQNGNWVNFTISGQEQAEQNSLSFTTGERPNYIPENCVVYTYPVKNMANLHWREHNTGYVKLTHNFNYLLDPEQDWEGKVILQGSGNSIKTNYTYNVSELKITFPIPQNLVGQTIYNIRISKTPTGRVAAVDENVERVVVAQTDTHQQTESNIEGERTVSLERTFYQLNVRTSVYPTFTEKINSMQLGGAITDPVMTGIHNVIRFGSITEEFDAKELANPWQNPLISIQFELNNNYWYNTYIKPLVYDGYPRLPNLTFTNRVPELLGIPPVKSAYIYLTKDFSSIDFSQTGSTIQLPSCNAGMIFTGVYVMYQDYMNLRDKSAAAYDPNHVNAPIYLHYMNSSFQSIILEQQYVIKIRYVIPGENIVTSTKDIVCQI